MRTQKITKLALLFLCITMIMAPVLTGCTAKETAGTGVKPVVVYVADIFNTLNPYDTGAFSDSYVFNQVYESLAKADDQGNAIPSLAKSWDISADALTYTMKLVDNAVFHNGEKFKASDVVFTYNFAKGFPAKKAYYSMVKTVEALDDYTVKFTLNNPYPLFLSYTQQVPIVNEKFVTENKKDISKVASGTGPYKLVTYDPAVKVILTANKDYRLGRCN
jgi:ABC-type transport system substrate-binding protein